MGTVPSDAFQMHTAKHCKNEYQVSHQSSPWPGRSHKLGLDPKYLHSLATHN
jgi:hypothetical protein